MTLSIMMSLFNHVVIMNSLFNLFIMVLYFIFIENVFIKLCSQCPTLSIKCLKDIYIKFVSLHIQLLYFPFENHYKCCTRSFRLNINIFVFEC